MQGVLYQPKGRASEGFQRVLQRHGAEVSMRFREWQTQQIGSRRVRHRLSGQSVPAAVEQMLDGLAHSADLRGKLHRNQIGQEIRLRLSRCGPDTGIAPHLYFAGD